MDRYWLNAQMNAFEYESITHRSATEWIADEHLLSRGSRTPVRQRRNYTFIPGNFGRIFCIPSRKDKE
jgi:hypothetical protein